MHLRAYTSLNLVHVNDIETQYLDNFANIMTPKISERIVNDILFVLFAEKMTFFSTNSQHL